METIVLKEIPFELEPLSMIAILGQRFWSSDEGGNSGLISQARAIASPKAACLVSPVKPGGEDCLEVGGINFHSRVLHRDLSSVGRAFPYIATCGAEIDRWAEGLSGTQRLPRQALCGLALKAARFALQEEIARHFQTGILVEVNPGSTVDWELPEQCGLFELLDRLPWELGVSLGENLWMSPAFSVTGILYQGDASYSNCRLCPMEGCPLRKEVYEAGLYERAYSE